MNSDNIQSKKHWVFEHEKIVLIIDPFIENGEELCIRMFQFFFCFPRQIR